MPSIPWSDEDATQRRVGTGMSPRRRPWDGQRASAALDRYVGHLMRYGDNGRRYGVAARVASPLSMPAGMTQQHRKHALDRGAALFTG